MCVFSIQYLGFGMPTDSSEGRRAAQASAAPMENDQTERDASLRKVEARDLVEFGMIPVRIGQCNSKCILQIQDLNQFHFFLFNFFSRLGICWPFSGFSSIPQFRRRYVSSNFNRTEERPPRAVQNVISNGQCLVEILR